MLSLLTGEAVGRGDDVFPELCRRMSCVVEHEERATRPGLSQFPGGHERTAEIQLAMDEHGWDVRESMRIAQQSAPIEPGTVPEVVGHDGQSHAEASVGVAGVGDAAGVQRDHHGLLVALVPRGLLRTLASEWASNRA